MKIELLFGMDIVVSVVTLMNDDIGIINGSPPVACPIDVTLMGGTIVPLGAFMGCEPFLSPLNLTIMSSSQLNDIVCPPSADPIGSATCIKSCGLNGIADTGCGYLGESTSVTGFESAVVARYCDFSDMVCANTERVCVKAFPSDHGLDIALEYVDMTPAYWLFVSPFLSQAVVTVGVK